MEERRGEQRARLARGASPFRGSPDHFPLRLRRLGLTVPQVVLVCGVASGVLGVLALAVGVDIATPLRAAWPALRESMDQP